MLELEDGYRVNHSTVLCEALEFQELLDREHDRWDTIEILTTDSNVIGNWQLFHSVLDPLRDMLRD